MVISSHSPRISPTARPRKAMGLTAILITAALGFSACGQVADPTEAAEEFGKHLGTASFDSLDALTLTDSSVNLDSLAEGLAAMEDFPRTVNLESVTIDEDNEGEEQTATAHYTVTWQLDGMPQDDSEDPVSADQESTSSESTWTYATEATLHWDEEAEAWTPELQPEMLVPGLAEGGQLVVERDRAQRGDILGASDEPLVMQRPVRRIGIDKQHVLTSLTSDDTEPTAEEIDEALTDRATALSDALELDPADYVDRVLNAGDRAWVEFIVLRDDGQTDIPFEAINEIPGALASEDVMFLASTASFARGLFGTYGVPTAEQLEKSDGAWQAGVPTGLSGLQRMYNDDLAGRDGLRITVDNAAAEGDQAADSQVEAFERKAVDGSSITTTLDLSVQALAERTIDDSEVLAGLVAIRPSDGHILAAAEGPSSTSWPLAMTGSYAPGSTFKVVTALAMLRNGLTPESTVSCPATLDIEGTQIANYDGYPEAYVGDITLAEAIAESCNTTFVGQWEEISPEQIHTAGQALGLVAEQQTGFSGAVLGSIPTDVQGAEHAAGLFGQGVVESSPLGMATVAASIAAGQTVSPVLLTDPAVEAPQDTAGAGEAALTEEEAATLRELMHGPVATGTVPILQDVPGAPVLAKTGTAQFVEDGEMLAHTWIMAIHGDLAVSLFLHEGFAGAQTNGPILQEFLTELEELIPSEG